MRRPVVSLVVGVGILTRYERWGAAERDANRPLLWMHAPSVGRIVCFTRAAVSMGTSVR